MADESMTRTLEAQTNAIWPQEERLFLRYAMPATPCILDAGCGRGEAASRLAEPQVTAPRLSKIKPLPPCNTSTNSLPGLQQKRPGAVTPAEGTTSRQPTFNRVPAHK